MARQDILLIGLDYNSLRILEISLRKSGFMVASVTGFSEAIEQLRISTPDLIIIDSTKDAEAFEFATKLKSDYRTVPVVLISSNKEINTRIRALEIGIDDYLVKPIYIKEIIARIKIHLQKRERERIEEGITAGFIGSLSDIGLYDIIQTIELNKKSGILELKGKTQEGRIYFKNGQIVQANIGKYRGEPAIYRMLTLNEGIFKMSFLDIDIEPEITRPNNAIIMEGMRRLDEYMKYSEQLPELTTRLDIDDDLLRSRLKEIPDNINKVLKLIDNERSINDIIELSELDEIETLKIISALYFDGIVYDIFSTRSRDEKGIKSTLPEPNVQTEEVMGHTVENNRDYSVSSNIWAENVFKEEKVQDQVSHSRHDVGDMTIKDGEKPSKTREIISEKVDMPVANSHVAPVDKTVGEDTVSKAIEGSVLTPAPAIKEETKAEVVSQEKKKDIIFGEGQNKSTRDKVIENTLLENVTLSTSSYVKGSLLGKKKKPVKKEERSRAGLWIVVVLSVLFTIGIAGYKFIIHKGAVAVANKGANSKKIEDERRRQEEERLRRLEEEERKAAEEAKKKEEEQKKEEKIREEEEKKRAEEESKKETTKVEESSSVKEVEPQKSQIDKKEKAEEKAAKTDIEIDLEGYKRLLSSAQNLYKGGNSAAAKEALKQALIKNPRGFEAFTIMGQIDLEANKVKSAITYFKRAISYNNKYSPAYFYLGTSLQLNGDNSGAKKMYERYLKLAPDGEFANDVKAILSDLK